MLSEIWTATNAATTVENDGAAAKPNSAATSSSVPMTTNGMRRRVRSDARPAPNWEAIEKNAPAPLRIAVAVPVAPGATKRATCDCIAAPSSAAQCTSQANQNSDSANWFGIRTALARIGVLELGGFVQVHCQGRIGADYRAHLRAEQGGRARLDVGHTHAAQCKSDCEGRPEQRGQRCQALAGAEGALDLPLVAQHDLMLHDECAASGKLAVVELGELRPAAGIGAQEVFAPKDRIRDVDVERRRGDEPGEAARADERQVRRGDDDPLGPPRAHGCHQVFLAGRKFLQPFVDAVSLDRSLLWPD